MGVMRRTYAGGLAAALCAMIGGWGASLLPGSSAQAQEIRLPREVKIIVGSGVGGGYDAYARLAAPFLSKYLPGSPPVIVQNMPGGGGLKLANYMAQLAPRDGGTIAITNRNLIAAPLLGIVERANVQYEPAALTWLANLTSDVSFLILRPEVGARSIDDLRSKSIVVGSTSRADNNGVFPFVANNLLGTRFKVISGYASSNDMLLAMERAEIDGIVGFSWASLQVQRPAWLEGKRERLIMQLGLEPLPQARDVPRMLDFARSPLDRQALELLATLNTLGRPFWSARAIQIPDLRPSRRFPKNGPRFGLSRYGGPRETRRHLHEWRRTADHGPADRLRAAGRGRQGPPRDGRRRGPARRQVPDG